jgi:CRISPR-associated protein Csm4
MSPEGRYTLTYRATLHPRSATLTPWQADTLFGHLCWLMRYADGEASLQAFLAEYRRGAPPLLFSDGFPGDWLPRPLVPPPGLPRERAKAAQVRAMREAKAGKGVRWVSLDEFNTLRRGQPVTLTPRPALAAQRTVLKNQINRLTFGTTPALEEVGGGNLYNADELAFVQAAGLKRLGLDVSLYVRARDADWAARARELLRGLSQGGYGAKKTAGYGHFDLVSWEAFTGLDEPPSGANGFISLSNWVPAGGDPTQGFYATMVKYGKLGEEWARSENPFKFPLIMLTAGSSFYAPAPIREWYGRLVEGIAPAEPRVVQYSYAFAVPARLAEEIV